MKFAPLVLFAAIAPTFAQSVSIPAQIAGAALQQSQQVQTPMRNSCTPIIVQVSAPSYAYVEPKSGYAPKWKSDSFDRPAPFSATASMGNSFPVANDRTGDMQSSAWSNADAATQKIAASSSSAFSSSSSNSSSSSASSTVRSWNENGQGMTESTEETEVTVNGKTYKTFKHELKPTNIEPQSSVLYFCR